MKVDYKFLREVLGSMIEEKALSEVPPFDPNKLTLHKEWFKACFCEVDGMHCVSLRGLSVYKFLNTVDDEFLAEVEPEGLYDLVNFWLIKKAEVLVNKMQEINGVLN